MSWMTSLNNMHVKKKNILSIGHSYVLDVNRATVREVAKDLDLNVEIVAPSFFHGSLRKVSCEDEPNSSSLKVYRVNCYLSQKIHTFFYSPIELYKVFKSKKWDLIHIWEEPYIFSGWQLASFSNSFKIPYVFWTAQNIKKKYPPPFSYFEKQVLKSPKAWMACGQLVKETLIDEKQYPEKNMTVMPLAVDTSLFHPMNETERDQVKSDIGLNNDFLIGYLGRLNEDKGIPLILELLESIKNREGWNFIFWGVGELKSDVLDWVKRNNFEKRIKVGLLKHDEVPKMLPSLDLLLAPSQTMPNWKEQFGRMIVEAFASGIPVVGSDSGEIPYVIGDSGVVLSEKDVNQWITEVNSFLDEPQRKKFFIERGLKRAQEFSCQSVAKQYVDFYKGLLGV